MRRRLVLERGVEREIESATEWYEAERTGLGLDLAREVRGVFEKLVTRRVLGGVVVPGVSHELPVRRMLLKRFPYAVVFLAQKTVVYIVAFAHLKKRPDYWHRRLQRIGGSAPRKRR